MLNKSPVTHIVMGLISNDRYSEISCILYKSTRDGFDVLSAKQNQDAFNLYKSQRDADDDIRKELSDLKAQVAINAAVRPYQDKLIQCEIDKAFTAGINYTDRKTCKVIFMKPFITRALDKNFDKVTKTLDLISDKEGNIDIENIITEMMENLMNTNPFTFKTSFIGDIEIGGGEIKFNLPFTSKRLVLNITDLETFKEMLITKS